MSPCRCMAIALAIFTSLSLCPTAHAENSAAVVGSYQSFENAQRSRDQVQKTLGRNPEIVELQIRSSRWYRVVIPDANARNLVADLIRRGYKDAWFLNAMPDKTLQTIQRTGNVAQRSPGTARDPKPITSNQEATKNNPGTSQQRSKPTAVPQSQPTRTIEPVIIGKKKGAGVEATEKPISIVKLDDVNIRIDGNLDELLWAEIPAYDYMSVVEPDLLTTPRHSTRTRIFYTDEGIYVGITAEQPPDTLIPRLSSRDGDLNRDGTTFYLDTSGEGTYGFFFGVALGGTLTDGTLLPERQLSRLWDGAWHGAAATTGNGYSTEMFLPWSMMSMPGGKDIRKMAFAVSRKVAYLDEEWEWPALPHSKPRFMSGLQPMQLENVEPRQQLAFYPFSAATVNNMRDETDYRVGTDIFWRPSTNLQLTATLNPDFGTVESDDVVVNLTDFETFFPEKRLFFLEGNDTFITSPRSSVRTSTRQTTGARAIPSTWVLEPTTLVNTRRIGGAAPAPVIPDGVDIPDVELGKPTALAGAAKITGQNGPVRYGAMFATEEDAKFYGTQSNGDAIRLTQDGRDFGVLRFLFEDASKGRRSMGFISTMVSHPSGDAMTHGLDAHYLSEDGKFFWDAQILASDVENYADDTQGYGAFIDLNYIPKQGDFHRFTLDYFDDELDVSDLGFIRRNDARTLRYTFSRSRSQFKSFRNISNSISFSHEENNDGQAVRSSIFNRNILTFNNQNQLTTIVMLRPEQWDDRNSDGNGSYRTDAGGVFDISYGTASSKVLSASIGFNTISEPLGDISYTGNIGITYKPNDRFSFDLDYSYRRTDHWMVHLAGRTMGAYDATHIQPKLAMDLFLTAKQQLRFSLQWVSIKALAQDLYEIPINDGTLVPLTNGITEPTYNFTISRLTSQLRYRWEIAPLSDLFVVYTRGSNLPNRRNDEFDDLFHDAVTDPIIDQFVVKLRYRFGN